MNKQSASVFLLFLFLSIGTLCAKGVVINHPMYESGDTDVPAEISQWIESKLSKAKRQTPSDLSRENFFCKDTACIVGYIRGYSPQSDVKTAIAYIRNELTREDHTRVIEIFEDGRFEGKLPLNYPIYSNFYIDNRPIRLYIEPGQTLGIILDWDDIMQADRNYKSQKITFSGPLARINEELAAAERQLSKISIRNKGLELDIKEFMAFADSIISPQRSDLQTIINNESLHPTTRTVLRATNEMIIPYWYFTYDMNKIRSSKEPLDTTGFYDFLKKMPLDDHTLLVAPDFMVFINRFEYCTPFSKAFSLPIKMEKPAKSMKEYLFEELGLKQTAEDLRYFKRTNELTGRIEKSELDEIKKLDEEFGQRYPSQIKDYIEKYVKPLKQPSNTDRILGNWANKNTIYTQQLGLLPSITYDIIKVRDLPFQLGRLDNREEAHLVVDALTANTSCPFLKQEAERMINQTFPIDKRTAYELPETEKGTEIFRKAIDQHKGKYIFVDFWATTCGPCVYGIKQMKETRAKYKDHPEMVFVFLTNDKESPLAAYNKFVDEQEMVFTHRLSDTEFNYLRQLFAFNGIPRYVLVDKEGKIMNNNYGMHQFNQTVKELRISKE